jgi:hypothetical protein
MSLWKLLTAAYNAAGDYARMRIDAATSSLQQVSYEHHEIHSNSHYFVEDFDDTNFEATDVIDFVFTTVTGSSWVHLVFAYEAVGLAQLDAYEGATGTANAGTLIVPRANNRAKTYCGNHTAAGNNATVMTDANASFPVDGLIGWKIYNITDGSYGIVTDNDGTTVTVAALVGGTDNDWDTNDQYEINRSLSILRANQTILALGDRFAGQSGGDASNPNQGIPGGATRENEWILRPNTTYLFRFTSGVNDNTLSYNAEWYEHTDHN